MRTIFKKLSNHLSNFEKNGCANDNQFALFFNITEYFLQNHSIYITIRSSNWKLRISFLKMMAPRFIRSGVVTYKWLVLRHLPDIISCPSKLIERMIEQVAGRVLYKMGTVWTLAATNSTSGRLVRTSS